VVGTGEGGESKELNHRDTEAQRGEAANVFLFFSVALCLCGLIHSRPRSAHAEPAKAGTPAGSCPHNACDPPARQSHCKNPAENENTYPGGVSKYLGRMRGCARKRCLEL
jgi:hypothetical protein